MAGERSSDKKALLVRVGVEILTEKGFYNTPIDEIVAAAGVPKGSFAYYFGAKEAYTVAVIEAYADYFNQKLDRLLSDPSHQPVERIRCFIEEASHGMEKYAFRRGCLVGNLGQELGALDEVFRSVLRATIAGWENKIAACLEEAKDLGQIARSVDSPKLAKLFWCAWEGAVLGSKLERSRVPLEIVGSAFLDYLESLTNRHSP